MDFLAARDKSLELSFCRVNAVEICPLRMVGVTGGCRMHDGAGSETAPGVGKWEP